MLLRQHNRIFTTLTFLAKSHGDSGSPCEGLAPKTIGPSATDHPMFFPLLLSTKVSPVRLFCVSASEF